MLATTILTAVAHTGFAVTTVPAGNTTPEVPHTRPAHNYLSAFGTPEIKAVTGVARGHRIPICEVPVS